jgi:hypothetical protein
MDAWLKIRGEPEVQLKFIDDDIMVDGIADIGILNSEEEVPRVEEATGYICR